MKINVDMIYPIGSIYMNINLIDPSILFGGTWVRIEARYLMGAGKPSKNSYDGFGQITDGQISGLNFAPATLGEISHTLSVLEMPSHDHAARYGDTAGGDGSGYRFSNTSGTNRVMIENEGGGQAHNNLPPTLVVYMWKRTA